MESAAQGNYGAQGSLRTAEPSKRDSVQSISDDLGRQIERLAKLFNHLRAVADRIEGTRPTQVGEAIDGGAAIPHSLVADLRGKNMQLIKLIATCEDEAMRLTAALGIQL